jgi:transcriptional regulator of acetoin/glycerol metabolism
MAEARDGDYVASLTLARAQRVARRDTAADAALRGGRQRVREGLPRTTLRELGVPQARGLPSPRRSSSSSPPTCRRLSRRCAPRTPARAASPLQQLVRGRLVGRADEARTLRQHWDNAQQARGHLVLVSGEPGVGKTRLAQD